MQSYIYCNQILAQRLISTLGGLHGTRRQNQGPRTFRRNHRNVELFRRIQSEKALAKIYGLSSFLQVQVETARHTFLGKSFHFVGRSKDKLLPNRMALTYLYSFNLRIFQLQMYIAIIIKMLINTELNTLVTRNNLFLLKMYNLFF